MARHRDQNIHTITKMASLKHNTQNYSNTKVTKIHQEMTEREPFYDDIAHVLQNSKKRTYFV